MPEQKDTLGSNHVQTLRQLLKQANTLIEKAQQIDPAAVKKLEDVAGVLAIRLNNLEEKVASLPISDKQYTDTKDAVVQLYNAAKKKAAELEKQGPKPEVVFKFKGKNEATEEETVAFIKHELPSSGHGNISQALNDAILGRGKATAGLSGVLHASAGPKQKGKGCTLFFKRSGTVVEIVGIGQHEAVEKGQAPQYLIHFSSHSGLKEKKTFSM
ncbi:MAG: hypothetical protein NTY19_40105 [Planctomycetota bacterium]|nr:hypothetical protein [Planctomycetota bacterium]